MGVEVADADITPDTLDEMHTFVYEYLNASVRNEDEGGRMRWYPWHSAEYRYNHILNVMTIAERIAAAEGADVDIVRVAALFHDVAKLDADQEVHAEAGARVARQYLKNRDNHPEPFVERVCTVIEQHTFTGDLRTVSPEAQALIEADILDKVGANGTALMLLRMGYEARTHLDAATMVDRVYERGREAVDRVVSDTAHSIAHERLKRTKWFRDWLLEEVEGMEVDLDIRDQHR